MEEPNIQTHAFDVVICGGTPAGVAAAVRAARGGHRVLLTQHTAHLGGMCTNGLGQWDCKSDNRRSPIFHEVVDRLEAHYRERYGDGSPAHQAASYRVDHYPLGSYEPSVIEGIFLELIAAESGITVWTGVHPLSVEKEGGRICSIRYHVREDGSERLVSARICVDATYEGDLAALAGVRYRVGRESRDEHGEPHAGHIFTSLESIPAPSLASRGILNFHTAGLRQGGVDPASPGTADAAIQAYNARFCTCCDPANRILLSAPPAGYDRARYLTFQRRGLCTAVRINGKSSLNAPIMPGENWEYPEADWATRDRISRDHVNFALGLMWFLQHDESIPAEHRARFCEWGLPADEYTDNGNIPYEVYVRETRRIEGKHILTENDYLPREGFLRPRPFADSIAFTDWYLDSHSCHIDTGTWGSHPQAVGSAEYPFAGKVLLSEELRPGMVPYRSLVCQEVSNLIVPVCLSCTHIAWGAIRLEPVFMHLGEVAGFAACQALATGEAVNALDVSALQRSLLGAGASIAFFNQHREVAEHPQRAERELAACHGEHDNFDWEEKMTS